MRCDLAPLLDFRLRETPDESAVVGHSGRMRSTGDNGEPMGWARLDNRDNALNTVRLTLAALVLYGHGYSLAYKTAAPALLHVYAVDGFFAVSGYLIVGARLRTTAATFMWRRVLRVVPGLLTCVVVCAVVIAPCIAYLAAIPWTARDIMTYVLSNASIQFGWTLPELPFVNVSLWTLPYELACYALFAALLAVRPRIFAVLATLVLCTSINVLAVHTGAFPFMFASAARFGSFFAAGALLHLVRDRVPVSGGLALIAIVVALVPDAVDGRAFALLAPLTMAYALLWVGASSPTRVGSRHDVSYGVYIYGYPIQQLLTVAGASSVLAPILFALASLLLTLPFAWASWLRVERPAMRAGGAGRLASCVVRSQRHSSVVKETRYIKEPERALVE